MLDLINENADYGQTALLDSDPVAAAIIEWANKGKWQSTIVTAKHLLDQIKLSLDDTKHRLTTPGAMSTAVRRAAPLLRKLGLNVKPAQRTSTRRGIAFEKTPDFSKNLREMVHVDPVTTDTPHNVVEMPAHTVGEPSSPEASGRPEGGDSPDLSNPF